MREPEDMGWYEIEGEDGYPRACHGIKRLMPEGSKEISRGMADQISADVRAREPKSGQDTVASAAAAGVNLQPIQDQIDALAEAVVGHAKTLDRHEASVTDVRHSVESFMQGQKDLDGGGE